MDPDDLSPEAMNAIRSSVLPVELQPVEHDPFAATFDQRFNAAPATFDQRYPGPQGQPVLPGTSVWPPNLGHVISQLNPISSANAEELNEWARQPAPHGVPQITINKPSPDLVGPNNVGGNFGTMTPQEAAIARTPGTALEGMAEHLAEIPKRVTEQSESLRLGGTSSDEPAYNPAPAVEAVTTLGGIGMGAATENALGIFGGKMAKTADLAALQRAQDMAAGGATRDDIWRQTGWFQGADQQWRFEIPDQKAKLKPETGWDKLSGGGAVSDRLKHPEFYAAYPSAADVNMETMTPVGMGAGWRATYTPAARLGDETISPAEITLNRSMTNADQRSAALHELQHHVQEEEGFAPGGDAGSPEVKLAAMQRLNEAKSRSPEAKFGPGAVDLYRRQVYHDLAGEVEARNVQARRDMAPAMRRNIPPWQTEDTLPADQVVTAPGLGGRQLEMAVPPETQTPLGFWEHRQPPAPVLKGNPDLRGSMNTLDNMPFTYKGKSPNEWTPQEFEEVGDQLGIGKGVDRNGDPLPKLGPESPAQTFKYKDGGTFNIPGGLSGKFTYYDLLRMKADGIDPSRIEPSLHALIQQKLGRTMTPEADPQAHAWSGITFGMTSPNNPLFPNQLTASILRLRDPAFAKQLGDMIPWKAGDKVPNELRDQVSNKIAERLGIQAGPKGGLGTRGTADYTRIAELAQMWQKNPQFFVKTPTESWQQYVERLSSQVPGLSMKTGSLSGVWQDPADASISAIDRHMVNEWEKSGGQLFTNDADRQAFEQRAVERYNKTTDKNVKANAERQVTDYSQLPPGFVSKMRLEEVGDARKPVIRTAKGTINASLPPHIANANWPVEPQKANLMGPNYQRALQWNAQHAQQQGLPLFMSQWNVWDRLRRRLEPHENMFPGLERAPAMSRDQLREVNAEHTASGHKTYSAPEDEASGNLRPTKPRPNPARFAYFAVPPLAFGAIGRHFAGESQ